MGTGTLHCKIKWLLDKHFADEVEVAKEKYTSEKDLYKAILKKIPGGLQTLAQLELIDRLPNAEV